MYGTVNPATGVSYTEMEYDYAKSKDIPVLVFAIDDSVVLPDEKQERDKKKIEKLDSFRKKAMTNRLASIWKTSEDLTGAIAISIMRAKDEISRPGWQRATDYDEASLRREMMNLQKTNENLLKDLTDAETTIASFAEQSDVAFEKCKIKIEYYYYADPETKMSKSMTVGLPELFSIIATEMMDVAITENSVEIAITKSKLFSRTSYINDGQIMKKILNQLRALKLVRSSWSEKRSTLFWELTVKGRKVRDEMILIRNPSE
jgi:hypothetical protein